MAGRYVLEAAGSTEWSERFQLRRLTLDLPSYYNIGPMMNVPIIAETAEGEREARWMKWGLAPRWTKPGVKSVAPINARAESVVEKPMFRSLLSKRRCLVPASGFYEWRKTGGERQPFYISVPDEPTFTFAGLYDEPRDEDDAPASFTIVTTTPNQLMKELHDRMPVILNREDEEEWISKSVTDYQQVERLLAPLDSAKMIAWPVGPAIGNVKNHGPDLIKPIGEPLKVA
jgi:putative SOS response-associated peptidase YedK